jgi:uncharacterized protein (TIGR02453 family)
VKSFFPGFPPEALKFLRRLKRNNNREWFLEHKEIYEQKVKIPMTGLVLALGGEMGRFAPELNTDPKRAIYRIYRDIRFSRDKTPYKTHIAAAFAHRGTPKHAGGGLYFHIAPDEVLIAGGSYMPGSAELRAIRHHIATHSEDLRKIINDGEFKKSFGGLEGDRLSRPPKGFLSDHPAADLLRYKQFLAYSTNPAELAESSDLLPLIVRGFRALMPLVRFLNAPFSKESVSSGGSR